MAVGNILIATMPLHAAMLGLEDLPHAASPDLVEDRVVAQDQRLGSALVDFLGLELGQVLALDELPSKFLGVLRSSLGRDEIFELAGSNDTGVGELLDELFEGDGHRVTQAGKSSFDYSSPPLAVKAPRGTHGSRRTDIESYRPFMRREIAVRRIDRREQSRYLGPIREPAGTGSFCGALGAKCACPPSPRPVLG